MIILDHKSADETGKSRHFGYSELQIFKLKLRIHYILFHLCIFCEKLFNLQQLYILEENVITSNFSYIPLS